MVFLIHVSLQNAISSHRRSLSPIAIRPSCLASVKRKFELDDSGMDQLQPPTKRTSGLLTSAASR